MVDYAPVLERFECLRPARGGQRWTARCPVHGDNRPSLALWVNDKGNLHCTCYAQRCAWLDIVRATGTTTKQWFHDGDQLMEHREIVATYDYKDEAGKPLFQVVRFSPKAFAQRRKGPGGDWIWNRDGVPPELYRLPELAASPGKPVVVVEGEKDADNLAKLGLLATTNPGGAGKWQLSYCSSLAGRRVAIIPDNDVAGVLHASQVAGFMLVDGGCESVRIVRLPENRDKDVSDWLARQPGSEREKRQALCELIRAQPEWKPAATRVAAQTEG